MGRSTENSAQKGLAASARTTLQTRQHHQVGFARPRSAVGQGWEHALARLGGSPAGHGGVPTTHTQRGSREEGRACSRVRAMGTFPDVARPVGDAARVHPGHEGAERAAGHLLAADDSHAEPVACNQGGGS